jgi:dephospho-CoA kinase
MERIAICGVMASGKTYLADALHDELDYTKFSLATGVKDLARDVFLMEGKDRKLLQQIGMKMRQIQPKVWINLLMRRVAEYSNSLKWAGDSAYDPDLATGPNPHPKELRVVVDDCRFINEVVAFKEAGWTIIRIHIDDDLQIKRLKKTYGKEADQHIQNRKDDSESEMNYMNDELFDLVVNAADDDSVVAQVLDWLQEQPTQRLNSR